MHVCATCVLVNSRVSYLVCAQGRYATLGMARSATDWRNLTILLTVVGGALGANWAVKSVTTARSQQKRKKALESLEKDQ